MSASGSDYEQLLRNIDDPFMLVDLNHIILTINDALMQVSGMGREQLIGAHCYRIFHDADTPPDDCPLEELKLSGTAVSRDMEFQPLGCWFRTSVWPLTDDGGVGRVLHLAQDVTSQVAAATALAASEKRLHRMFEDFPECILTIALSGDLLEANRAGLELLGCDPGDGKAGADIDWDAFRGFSRWQDLAGELRDNGSFSNREVILSGVDGAERIVLLTAHVIQDDGDNAHRFQVIVKDVSAYKRASVTMLQGMKMESLGRLAGGIAHGFNNALTAIRGYSDLAATRVAGNSDALEYLAELQKAVEKASGLTRQLLVFSSTEGVATHPVDLGEVIAEEAGKLARQAGDDYTIEPVIAPDLWLVEADVGLLGQVLMIMVNNAREAMPDGGRIQIAAENISPDQPAAGAQYQSVRITISDEGEGIVPENLARVFDPFFSTREAGRNSGMGLAIAHSIIRQHGGWIDVESAPGEGASFSINLPRFQAEQEEAAAIAPRPAVRPSGRKILLVEDEPEVRRMAFTWLSRNGYQVFSAQDAREARVIFEREQGDIDLVFSDMVMPGESGFNLVLSLLEQKPQLRAMIASGYSGEDARQTEIETRGISFMQKPYALVVLLEQIDRILDQ